MAKYEKRQKTKNYFSDLDEFFEHFVHEEKDLRYTVAIASYKGREKKIQITRKKFINQQWKFTTLGRIPYKTMKKLLPLIEKCVEILENEYKGK